MSATPRTRVFEEGNDTNVHHLCVTPSGLPVSAPYNVSRIMHPSHWEGSRSEISDVSHSNFKRRMSFGEILMGPLTLEKESRIMSPGSITGTNPSWGQTWTYFGDLIHGAELLAPRPSFDIVGDIPKMEEVALIKAYAKMKAASVMGGEVLSELDKTAGMLRHPFRRSRQLLQKMHKAKAKYLKRSGSNLSEACSNAWLEYRYGWQPIILDAETIRDEVHRKRARYDQHLVARSNVRQTSFQKKVLLDQASADPDFSPYRYSGEASFDTIVSVSAGIMYDLKSRTTTENLQQISGSRPQDMVQLMWEKIPYSFVVDWFANVGDWLQAVTPDPFVSVRSSWVTTVRKKTSVYSCDCSRALGSYWATGSAGSSTYTNTYITRTINPSLTSTPVLTMNPLSKLHQVDALSLSLAPIKAMLKGLKFGKRS